MTKEFKIKFVPTGNVFTLPESEVDNLLKNDRGNYQVLDDNYQTKENEVVTPERSVLDQVLDNDQNDNPKDEKTEEKPKKTKTKRKK